MGSFIEAVIVCRRGQVTPEVAEALGIKEALGWIKRKNWSNVEVESDCLVVIQSIRSKVEMPSYFGRIILDCKRYLSELQSKNISVKFIRRSANALAHCLAKATSTVSDCILGVDEISPTF